MGGNQMSKKYFSLAIFYDERKNIIISSLAQLFMLCMPMLIFIANLSRLRDEGRVHNSTILISYIPYFMLFVICVVTVFYSYSNKESKYSFLFTQPFSRDSIVITRTIGQVASYTIPMIIYGIISSILIYTNKSLFIKSPSSLISSLISKLLVIFVMLTLTVAIVQLMQMIFGKSLLAGIVPIPIAILGIIELLSIHEVTSTKIPYAKRLLGHILDFSNKNSFNLIYKDMDSSFYSWQSVILIMITALILYICILLNRRIQIEDMSGMFMFNFAEKIVRFIFSMFVVAFSTIFISLVFTFIYFIFHGNTTELNFEASNNTTQMILLGLDILWATLTIIVYRVIGQIINRRRVS